MLKMTGFMLLTLGITANAALVPMPEPSAVPELVICLAGIGYFAWRRKASK